MADITKVRIGVTGARELEIEVADAKAAKKAVEAAVAAAEPVVWIEDTRGHTYGILLDKLAFVQIEGDISRGGIGFAQA